MKKLTKTLYAALPDAIWYLRPALATIVASIFLLLALLTFIASHIQFK